MQYAKLFVFSFFFFYSFFLFAQKQNPKVRTGLEVLKASNFDRLKGKKIGLVTNATGVDNDLRSTADIFFEATKLQLVAYYAPEHGIRGDYSAGEYVEFYTDARTKLPVYSLYGKTRKPTAEMLKGVEVLVYDIQDIGCRSYTYISTMGMIMEAAAENNIEVVILDRPNPLGGLRVEGNLTEDDCISFVSQFKIPYLYGLTCGELAMMLNEEKMLGKKCKLEVIKMEGWKRKMNFEDTGLEWVPTSPHIPHRNSAYFYPATGIVGELYLASIGVGYTVPFQTFATEWIDGQLFCEKMNALKLEGVNFRPIFYKPYYNTSKDKKVQGVQIYITDFEKVRLSDLQFYLMQVSYQLYPEKKIFELCEKSRWDMFDKVSGSKKIRELFSQNYRFEDIKAYWTKDEENFKKIAKKYWLYSK